MAPVALLSCSLAGWSQEPPSSPEDVLAQDIDRGIRQIPGFSPSRLAPPVEDGEWLRRIRLDLVGMPPTGDEVRDFLADTDPDRRAHAVDRLLASPQFANTWARRFAEVFLGTTVELPLTTAFRLPIDTRRRLATGFVRWMEAQIRQDLPWRTIVAQMASATGPSDRHPEIAWKISLCRNGDPVTINLASVGARQILGLTLECSRCHDHPFARWTVSDSAGFSAFLARLRFRVLPATKERPSCVEISEAEEGEYSPGRGLIFKPCLLTTQRQPEPSENRQEAFGRLLADAANTALSLAVVNRVWSWLMGRGIVEPVDDFNLRNKPLSPGLLEVLRRGFDGHDQSIRFLVRAICRSEAYARSSAGPEPVRKFDGTRGWIRPLSPEELVNSMLAATCNHPVREFGVSRLLAWEAAPATSSPACEVTRLPFNASLALFARNSPDVWQWIRSGGILTRIQEGDRPLEEKVDSMYLQALSRNPSETERERLAHFIRVHGPEGFEDAYWALLNSHEFMTRH
jgi:hypothetical protein